MFRDFAKVRSMSAAAAAAAAAAPPAALSFSLLMDLEVCLQHRAPAPPEKYFL